MSGKEQRYCFKACLDRSSSIFVNLPNGGVCLVCMNDVATCLIYTAIIFASILSALARGMQKSSQRCRYSKCALSRRAEEGLPGDHGVDKPVTGVPAFSHGPKGSRHGDFKATHV